MAEVRGVIDAVKRAAVLSTQFRWGWTLSGALRNCVSSHFSAQRNAIVPVVAAAVPHRVPQLPALMYTQTGVPANLCMRVIATSL